MREEYRTEAPQYINAYDRNINGRQCPAVMDPAREMDNAVTRHCDLAGARAGTRIEVQRKLDRFEKADHIAERTRKMKMQSIGDRTKADDLRSRRDPGR